MRYLKLFKRVFALSDQIRTIALPVRKSLIPTPTPKKMIVVLYIYIRYIYIYIYIYILDSNCQTCFKESDRLETGILGSVDLDAVESVDNVLHLTKLSGDLCLLFTAPRV